MEEEEEEEEEEERRKSAENAAAAAKNAANGRRIEPSPSSIMEETFSSLFQPFIERRCVAPRHHLRDRRIIPFNFFFSRFFPRFY